MKPRYGSRHFAAILITSWFGALAAFTTEPAPGAILALSTNDQATINFVGGGSLTFQKGDIVQVTVNSSGMATSGFILYSFGNVLNIDALYIRPNGKIILSTKAEETIGSLTFRKGDLVEFDPSTNTAILFLNGSRTINPALDAFGNTLSVFRENNGDRKAGDIDGIHLIDDDPSRMLLSIEAGPIRMGSNYSANQYNDEDIILYNALTDQSSMYFDFTPLFGNDVDGVSLHDNGNLLLTTNSAVTLKDNANNNITFSKGDVFEFNQSTVTVDGLLSGRARLFFSKNNFSATEDLEGIHYVSGRFAIPEPGTLGMAVLWACGGAAWAVYAKRRWSSHPT